MTPADAPLEANPDRIPPPEDVERLKDLFAMVDEMHLQVHSPWGMSWVAIQAALVSLRSTFEWANDARISHRYRYRIDAPLDPQAQVPDEIPKEWT